mmetsp:Transcript_27779/g.41086  ORF Transcript_27779/g.41086 Transcript_27779/m.41086 type:complete len:704 (+) Transcript_27779:118-2229(+)
MAAEVDPNENNDLNHRNVNANNEPNNNEEENPQQLNFRNPEEAPPEHNNNNNNNMIDNQALQNDRIRRLAARRPAAALLYNSTHNNRFRQYMTLSFASAFLLIFWAFRTRKQFYPAVVYLASSKFAYVTLGNAIIANTVLTFRFVTYLFLEGGLRDVERDAVGEGLRWGLTETCLALTIFREEVNIHMSGMFLTLALGKCLHWSVELRGAHLQQTDAMHVDQNDDDDDNGGGDEDGEHARIAAAAMARMRRRKRHFGFLSLTVFLFLFDIFAVIYCATACATNGPSVHILFGFEAAILLVSSMSTLATYALHIIDNIITARGKTFHSRGYITFALELGSEACKFLFYLIFFTIVFTYYGMPINIFRDLWMSYTNLRRKLASFVKYRQLTSNMNERFDDATQEELDAVGGICIICRDHMDKGKKLPCGHVFHFYCLREWLQQQQTCPTCRSEIPTKKKKKSEDATANGNTNHDNTNHDNNNNNNQHEVNTDTQTQTQIDTNTEVQPDQTTQPQPTPQTPQTPTTPTTPTTPPSAASAASAVNPQNPTTPSQQDEDDDVPPFPCFYSITNPNGATVYQESTPDLLTPIRNVPKGKMIVCTQIQWHRSSLAAASQEEPHHDDTSTQHQPPSQGGRMMLQMPDGWVLEDDLTRIPIPLAGLLEHSPTKKQLKLPSPGAAAAAAASGTPSGVAAQGATANSLEQEHKE